MSADDQAPKNLFKFSANFFGSSLSDHFSLIIFDNCFAILLKYPYFMSFCVRF